MARLRRKNIIRRINTLKWVMIEKSRSFINNILGFIGLFLTDNNRISQVLGHTDLFDEYMLRQILGLDDNEAFESGMVMRDLKTRRIWVLYNWDWEV